MFYARAAALRRPLLPANLRAAVYRATRISRTRLLFKVTLVSLLRCLKFADPRAVGAMAFAMPPVHTWDEEHSVLRIVYPDARVHAEQG